MSGNIINNGLGNGTICGNKQVSELDSIRQELGYLTESGLRYLKIDIANTFGLDKQSYEDRISFVDSFSIERIKEEEFLADSPYEYRTQLNNYLIIIMV